MVILNVTWSIVILGRLDTGLPQLMVCRLWTIDRGFGGYILLILKKKYYSIAILLESYVQIEKKLAVCFRSFLAISMWTRRACVSADTPGVCGHAGGVSVDTPGMCVDMRGV